MKRMRALVDGLILQCAVMQPRICQHVQDPSFTFSKAVIAVVVYGSLIAIIQACFEVSE